MNKLVSRMIQFAFLSLLTLLLIVPQDAFAQNHVVSSAALQQDVASASAARQQNIAQVDALFALPQARQALKSHQIDYRQVTNAVPQLSDKDLARLAQISQKDQRLFAAGQMSNRDLLWIIVAVALLILIIVAVHN